MEQRHKFPYKLATFRKALISFQKSLQLDLSMFNEEAIDAIKNGRIQKFEFCIELTWKTIKKYLDTYHDIDSKSPAGSIKEFFLVGLIDENEYDLLSDMLDDRNVLSHEYSEDYFEEIHDKLNDYFKVMKKVYDVLEAESREF